MEWIMIPISFFCAYYTLMYAHSLLQNKKEKGFIIFLILLSIPLIILPVWLTIRV